MNVERREYRIKQLIVGSMCILIAGMMYLFQNADMLLRTIGACMTVIAFYTLDHLYRIRFTSIHYFLMTIIAFASFLLSPLYFMYPYYDKIQHFIQPMMITYIFFFIVSKLSLRFRWKMIFACALTLSFLGIFEVIEYGLDYFFNLNLQGVYLRDISGLNKLQLLIDPLSDTIIDIIYGLLGTLSFGATYYLLKRRSEK